MKEYHVSVGFNIIKKEKNVVKIINSRMSVK